MTPDEIQAVADEVAALGDSDLITESIRVQRQMFREGSTQETEQRLKAIDDEFSRRAAERETVSTAEISADQIEETFGAIPDDILRATLDALGEIVIETPMDVDRVWMH